MKIFNRNIFIILVLGFIALPILLPAKTGATNSKAKTSSFKISAEAQRKAGYIFLEAQRVKALGNIDAFFELLRHAHAIDPTNSSISYYIGYCMLTMDNPTNERNNKGLEYMNAHFVEKPDDYYESYLYGDANSKLGKFDEALNVWNQLASLYPEKTEVKLQLADAYGNKKDFKHAIDIFDTIELTEGKSIPLTLRKIRLHMANNDTLGTINEGLALLKSAPSSAEYNLLMGNIFMQLEKGDSAVAYYNRAQELDPSNGYTYLSKASFYNQQGDSVNYDDQIYKALTNANISVDDKLGVLTDYSRQLLQQNDSSERVNRLFKVLIEQHPHESKIHDLYSQYLVALKDYKKASEQLGYVLDIEPTSAEDWKKLMFVNLMDENYDGAIKAAGKALEYNPDNIELYQYVAPAYFQMKQYDKAKEVYTSAIQKVDSTDVETRSNLYGGLGDVYFAEKDTVNAFASYEKALDLNPGNTMILNNYAYFLAEAGIELDKAERMSALSVKESPDNPTFLDTYAWIFFKKGDYKLALVYIKSAIEKNTERESADIYEHYGDILFMNGNPDEALTYWEKALKLNPASELLGKKVKNKTYFYK